MNDLIVKNNLKVEITQLPVIKSNLSTLKGNIESLLKKYDFIVSEDDIKAVRVKTAELNKLATTLDTLRKEKVKEVSEPIKKFEEEVKEIYSIIKKTRQTLLDQMVKFENETKQKLENLLKGELRELNEIHGIKPEFKKASYADLVIISNLTKGGKVTKKANDELNKRILQDKQIQEKIQTRLIALDGICLKSGLEAPLEKHNVQHFLYSDNYDEQLNELIKVELKRQDETKRRIAQQFEDQKIRENNALEEQKTVKQTKEIVNKAISTSSNTSSKMKPANNSTKYQVIVTMEFETNDMDIEMLKRATQNRFIKCGFESIRDIKVVKKTISPKTNSLLADGSLF